MPEKPTYEEMEKQVKFLEKALSESENRFRKLLQNSSDIQVIIDDNGIEQFVSDSVEAITGYSPHEFIGKSGFEFVHPDDLGVLSESLQRVKKDNMGFVGCIRSF
jgi:PAS domain S-box-containing protein